MASGFQPPKNFSPPQGENVVQHWRDWKEQFSLYLLAAKETQSDDEVKIGMLKYSMGPEWIKTSKTFVYETAGDDKKFDKVIEQFDRHFEPKKLLKSYTTRFSRRSQGATESVNDFITAVRELATHCEFGALEERMVCTQISNGIRDTRLKEKLWESDLNLTAIMRKCHLFEQSEETKKLTGIETDVHAVNKHGGQRGRGRGRSQQRGGHRGRGRGRSQPPAQNQQQQQQQQQQAPRGRGQSRQYQCRYCGMTHGSRQCQAYGKECKACGKIGHFARVCRSVVQYVNVEQLQNSNMPHDFDDETDDVNAIHVWTVENEVFMNSSDFRVELVLKGKQSMSFRIDTGAGTSVISKSAYEKLRVKPQLENSNTKLKGIWGSNKPVGMIKLPVRYKDKIFNVECQVIDSNVPNLLSACDSMNMNLVKRVFHNEENDADVLSMYKDVFTGTGRIPGDYSLPIDHTIPPVALNARPLPAALRDATKKKLDELETLQIISKIPVGEPTP